MLSQAGASGAALDLYNKHGHVQVMPTTDDAIDQLAEAFRQTGGKAISITANNRDVASINAALRREAKDIGIIKGSEISITAIPRGKHAKPLTLKIATGDRLSLAASSILEAASSSRMAPSLTMSKSTEIGFISVQMTTGISHDPGSAQDIWPKWHFSKTAACILPDDDELARWYME